GEARDRGDVGGDVLGVRAPDEVARHPRSGLLLSVRPLDEPRGMLDGEQDLAVDDVPDRRLLEALRPWAGEGVVEVGADLSLGSGVRERVAATALLGEELLAVRRIGLPLRDPARAATGR